MFHNPEHDTRFLDLFERYVKSNEEANTLQTRMIVAKEATNTLQERMIELRTRSVTCQEEMLEIARVQSKVGNKFIGTVTKKIREETQPSPDACSFCKMEGAGERNGPQHHSWCTRHIPL